MSKLKPVDAAWILRRLERWGRRDEMPFLGPTKARMVQDLVRSHAPQLVVEVGTMAGYSAIKIAEALPSGASCCVLAMRGSGSTGRTTVC